MTFTALTAITVLALAPMSVADPVPVSTHGKLLFLRCASCHDVKPGPSLRIGPTLHGLFGRQVASVQGYGYSTSLKSQTFVWSGPALDRWLTRPTDMAPGTSMAFAGITSAEDRKALIAYLAEATK